MPAAVPATDDTQLLPTPTPDGVEGWVDTHLADLAGPSPVPRHPTIRGGQRAADAALATFDVHGYASSRNEVWPPQRQGASGLSPWIRHGMLTLRRVWDHVAGGPARDVAKLRDELLWQSYARHTYARFGADLARPLRAQPPPVDADGQTTAWDREMVCMDLAVSWLEEGWVPNQARMWLASHWTVRHGARWQDGEDRFFRHLLDGSRAANRVGWQWTVGTATRSRYGFSRWQVERRAPGLCERCPLQQRCPVQDRPDTPQEGRWLPQRDPRVAGGTDLAGPATAELTADPEVVWLTAESLGDADPALDAHPDLPAVFTFDRPLLRRLRLARPRLVFLTETLADLATRRPLEVHLGDPVDALAARPTAVTHAPVPGFATRAVHVDVVALHPYPWLVRPAGGTVQSFSAWRRVVDAPDPRAEAPRQQSLLDGLAGGTT